ncbi:MAG TPA: FAD-dependent oxidoreductase [Steroidobacteraceae bacterium]|nr:FAD-dependent oxidoreductase [Steroidobacteraceae bacterium]
MQFDFIVIGAGMAGVSVADALAGSGNVALLEAEAQPGYHTTGRSAALFAPNYGSESFAALTRASAAFFHAPPAPHFPTPLLRHRGALYLARVEQHARLDEQVQRMRRRGAAVELLTPAAARARVSPLRVDYLAAAAYEPDVYDIDVEALLQGLLRRGRAAGVQLITHAQLGVPQHGRDGWQVPLGEQTLRAPVVVNAAGAWADQVAGRFGARPLGLRVLRRCAALIDAPPGPEAPGWPIVFDIDEEFYLKPEAGRLLISPADEEPAIPGDAYAEDLAIAVAVDRIQRALALDIERVHRSWAGLRTFAPDRDPVIGYDEATPGFFWCAGQGGYGIQSAPAYAQLAAALACGRDIPASVAAEGVTAAAVAPQRLRTAP